MTSMPCPTDPPDSSTDSPPTSQRWTPRLVLSLAALVLLLETLTISYLMISMAIPSIAAHYRTTQGAWLLTAFLLVGAITAPLVGKLADMYGKRRLLLACVTIAAVGAFICAVADSYAVMLVGRSVSGLLIPCLFLSYSLIRDVFPPKKVALAVSIATSGMGLIAIPAPFLTGWLIDHYGFRSIFWFFVIVLVLLLGMIAATTFRIVGSVAFHARPARRRPSRRRNCRCLDCGEHRPLERMDTYLDRRLLGRWNHSVGSVAHLRTTCPGSADRPACSWQSTGTSHRRRRRFHLCRCRLVLDPAPNAGHDTRDLGAGLRIRGYRRGFRCVSGAYRRHGGNRGHCRRTTRQHRDTPSRTSHRRIVGNDTRICPDVTHTRQQNSAHFFRRTVRVRNGPRLCVYSKSLDRSCASGTPGDYSKHRGSVSERISGSSSRRRVQRHECRVHCATLPRSNERCCLLY